MTDTTQPTAVPAHPDASTASTEPSGADLARLMLQRARQDAKQRGTDQPGPARRPKRKSTIQYHGRAPVGLAGAFQGLLADRGWNVPTAGGSILDRWPDIAAAVAPRLAAHTTAVAYDPQTGQLDLMPDSPAYATQLRLMTPRIITVIHETSGTAAVRTIRVRQPGALPAVPAPAPATGKTATEPAGPVKTRETASEGFRRVLALHHASYMPFQQDPALAAAVGRQEQFRRDLGTRMFPDIEDNQEDETPTSLEEIRAQQRQDNENIRIAAILRARAERAGQPVPALRPALRQTG
ncbi:DciA family protein [Streptomyces sp. TX20-6-3]|uniref:DciA family protein n=1 Tax=Streptomyces sp. TX20-6-3 TaxID=3028705 RepID=UPI0029B49D87|nr:DciA family protein [Streptomyces sp. TX20-6-3]MDX2565048.1 DciA family protein [Streptomyces sp. TX20-6-3]